MTSPRGRARRRWALGIAAWLIAICTQGSVGPAAAEAVTIDIVTSSADRSVRVETSTVSAEAVEAATAGIEVAVDRPRQRIHGVGASLTESSAYLIAHLPPAERQALLRATFDPAEGGLSVVGLVIGSSDFSLVHESLAESPVPDPSLSTFSIDRDRQWVIPVLREILAINPDVEIIARPWSAPAWMKNTGSLIFGQLLPEHEEAYARYLTRYVEELRAEGIEIDWLTVQNEPAAIQLTYPSMVMDADQQARLVHDHLGPALQAAGLPTRVLAWDHNWCDARPPGGCAGPAPPSFPLDVLDATDGAYPLAGTAFHCYGGDQVAANQALHEAWPDHQIWHTECSGGRWETNPFRSKATLVLRDLNSWSNATLFWNLALDPDGGPHLGGCDTCRGVLTIDPTTDTWVPEVEHDIAATIARFAPADSGVLETTLDPTTGLEAVGVCSPDRRPAVLVWNPGAPMNTTISFGTRAVAYEFPAASLTALRAPRGVSCELAALPTPPPAPTPSIPPSTGPTPPPAPIPSTSASPTSGPAPATPATPAAPVILGPTFTG